MTAKRPKRKIHRAVELFDGISLEELAKRLEQKSTAVLMELLTMGMKGVHIRTPLKLDTAKQVALKFGRSVIRSAKELEKNLAESDHVSFMEQHRRDYEDRVAGRGKYAPPKGACVLPGCGGEAVAKITNEYLGDPMHMIIGPGGANQMTRIHHGWHCTKCGLRYEFLPKGPATS